MPNHCQNYLVLSHTDAREIGRAKLAILEGKLFEEFVPCPPDLLREGAASHGGPKAAEYEKIREEMAHIDGFFDYVLKYMEPDVMEISVAKREPLKEEIRYFIRCILQGIDVPNTFAIDALDIALKA